MSVFVSHATADEAAVKDIVQILGDAQISVWYDQHLQLGDVWWAEILRRIRQCQVFIFVVSDASVRSKPCLAELQYARDLNRTILPVEIQRLSRRSVNPVSDVQMISMPRITAQDAVKLVSAIYHGTSVARPLPVSLPREPPIPYAYLQELLVRIDSSHMSPDEQLVTVNMLRQNYLDEVNTQAKERIADAMRKLASKQWATNQTVDEVAKILGHRKKPSPQAPRGYSTDARSPGSTLNMVAIIICRILGVIIGLLGIVGIIVGTSSSYGSGPGAGILFLTIGVGLFWITYTRAARK